MTIVFEKNFVQSSPAIAPKEIDHNEIKQLFNDIVSSHESDLDAQWLDEHTVAISNKDLSIHKFLLEIEKHGKKVVFSTIQKIEIL